MITKRYEDAPALQFKESVITYGELREKSVDVSAELIRLGIKEKERAYYWKIFFWTLFKKPALFPIAIDLVIKGFHFRKISDKYVC